MNKIAELFTGENGRSHYDLLAALRGPDFENAQDVKHILTARLRYLMLTSGDREAMPENIDFPGDVRTGAVVSKSDLKFALDQARNIKSLGHLLSHLRSGLEAAYRLGYIDSVECDFLRECSISLEYKYEPESALLYLAEHFPQFLTG